MNFLGGGERHNSAHHRRTPSRSADSDTAPPGDLALLASTRPGDVRGFVHKRIFGGLKGAIGGILGGPGGIIGGAIGGFVGGGGPTQVPQATRCPPGFLASPGGCVPRFTPTSSQPVTSGGILSLVNRQIRQPPQQIGSGEFVQPTMRQAELRTDLGFAADPAAGVPVMGRFGAGFEPSVIMTDTRRCGRGAVLGVDGICYNKRDLRNTERFWPRGRRPLLTGGEMRAISTASSAAKKLQRKQKQLESLGLLKRPAPRTRRALPAGHRAQLAHTSSHE